MTVIISSEHFRSTLVINILANVGSNGKFDMRRPVDLMWNDISNCACWLIGTCEYNVQSCFHTEVRQIAVFVQSGQGNQFIDGCVQEIVVGSIHEVEVQNVLYPNRFQVQRLEFGSRVRIVCKQAYWMTKRTRSHKTK